MYNILDSIEENKDLTNKLQSEEYLNDFAFTVSIYGPFAHNNSKSIDEIFSRDFFDNFHLLSVLFFEDDFMPKPLKPHKVSKEVIQDLYEIGWSPY